jgi:hypothetical protein
MFQLINKNLVYLQKQINYESRIKKTK